MSQREYAVSLINGLPEEKLDVLVAFLKTFTQDSAGQKSKQNENDEKRKAFERLNRLIEYIPVGDEKEELAKHREERYGS